MSARAARRPESSRQKIHDAALRLFARHGFEGVGLQRIADEVGLHKSSLFHHYDSKLDLAREIYEDCVARVLVPVRLLSQDDPERAVDLIDEIIAAHPEFALAYAASSQIRQTSGDLGRRLCLELAP